MKKRFLSVFCWISCIAFAPALAAPSGLLLIPTADVVPDRELVAELQLDGSLEHGDADHTRLLNLQVGLMDVVEFGADFDLSDDAEERWLLNAKVVPIRAFDETLAAALGARNYGEEHEPEFYAVATRTWGDIRAHAGATYSDPRGLDVVIGMDYKWREGWWASAEWTSGEENAGAIGLNIPLPGPFDLYSGILIPNNSEGDVAYSIHLVFSHPLWGRAK